jgi:hypothetical protein
LGRLLLLQELLVGLTLPLQGLMNVLSWGFILGYSDVNELFLVYIEPHEETDSSDTSDAESFDKFRIPYGLEYMAPSEVQRPRVAAQVFGEDMRLLDRTSTRRYD